MAELLNVQDLSAGYGGAVVLHEVSLSIDQGQTLALLGRNGTGKTTLINTLAGATQQHAGDIQLGGQVLHKLPSHERAAAPCTPVRRPDGPDLASEPRARYPGVSRGALSARVPDP